MKCVSYEAPKQFHKLSALLLKILRHVSMCKNKNKLVKIFYSMDGVLKTLAEQIVMD